MMDIKKDRSRRLSRRKAGKSAANTGAGIVAGGGAVVGVLAFMRSLFGDRLPWEPEGDVALAAAISSVVIPAVTAAIAYFRDRRKHPV
jgi:ABC-type antimicrobial peptide transport system permease subunit